MANVNPDSTTSPERAGLFPSLIRSTSAIALLRLFGSGVSFILNIFVARSLNATEFGIFSYILAWTMTLGMLGLFGLDRLLTREIPIYNTQAAWKELRGLSGWANWTAGMVSLILFGLVFTPWLFFGGPSNARTLMIWLAGGLLIPLLALGGVQQSTLRGLHRPASGQVAETVIQPLAFLVLLAIAIVRTDQLAAGHVLTVYALATAGALVFGAWQAHRALPHEALAAPPIRHGRKWAVGASRMLIFTGLVAINSQVDVLVLGAFKDVAAVGVYAAALRGASIIPLLLNIAVIAAAPTLAGLYNEGKRDELKRFFVQISRSAWLGGLPVAMGLLLFGRWFLRLYGAEFASGQTALVILSLGQLVNIAAGPVATLLVMTGHERDAIIGMALSTAANFLLSASLIPLWGINGAAVAAASGLSLWNLVLLWYVWKRLAIAPAIPGFNWLRSPG